MNHRSRFCLSLATLPLILGAAACSDPDNDGDDQTFTDDGTVPGDTVQAQLESDLEANGIVGTIDSCDDIDDKVGATTTCAATIDDIDGEVTVTVQESTDTETLFTFDYTEFGYEAVPE